MNKERPCPKGESHWRWGNECLDGEVDGSGPCKNFLWETRQGMIEMERKVWVYEIFKCKTLVRI